VAEHKMTEVSKVMQIMLPVSCSGLKCLISCKSCRSRYTGDLYPGQ